MKASALIVGRTYFRLTFADRDLTMPGVEPLVFLGRVVGGDDEQLIVVAEQGRPGASAARPPRRWPGAAGCGRRGWP